MPRKSQAENDNYAQNEQKDPFFPKGFAKVDHNSINIRELLQPYKERKEAVPDSLASLHLDLELNAGTLKKRSRHYFVTCWNWGWKRVQNLLDERQINDNIATTKRQTRDNITTTSRQQDDKKKSSDTKDFDHLATNSRQTCDKQTTTKRQTRDNITTTSRQQIKEKEKEKEQKKEEEVIVLPDWIPLHLWESFVEHRIAIKNPLTSLAAKGAITTLRKLREDGEDIERVMSYTIASGKYPSFYPQNKNRSQFKSKSEKAYDANMKRLQELGDSEVPF